MKQRLITYLFFSFLMSGSVFAMEPVKGDTTEYRIDTVHSRLYWSCNIHHGYMYLQQGCLKMSGENLIGADILMKMDSVFDQDITYQLMKKTLQNILRSDVFFNTKKYPYSRFVLDHARHIKGSEYEVTGDLELTGVEGCITFKVRILKKGDHLEIKSDKFYINRLRWGITSYSAHVAKSRKNFIVSDSIGISFDLRATPKK
ncbi:YceI family protein [Candidatus Sulfidibacterium hydrothermale]|uniref:YceI family protein n=1 Tax=Candidatus Sulfidibacterium hydrothermale TaxID=2875962 RepID=UPI001F0AA3A9|nr:YceI family protein [Candidatus Sulfidibacterium hydrothermale]UBM61754.1 YceI family protein [Candidatus Sulfidibacterium hydrothermale]